MIDHPDQRIILVSGATGQQGGAVARHLLETGFSVRALTRNPDQKAAQILADKGAEIVKGNFDNRESLDFALEGAYGAYSVQDIFEAGIEAEIQRGKYFADAANDAGIKHFVYSSSGGAGRNSGISHVESKWEVENYIRTLDLPTTFLRPAAFMENWTNLRQKSINLEEGTFTQPLSPDTSLQQIAVDDIGAFASMAFTNPKEWKGRAIEIAGDETTMVEMTDILSNISGKEIEYVQVPWDTFKDQAGSNLTTMYRWFEEKGFQANISKLREIYPRYTSLESFLRKHEGQIE
jgi:uncharacterized protein YbjT (DUF2867 family)